MHTPIYWVNTELHALPHSDQHDHKVLHGN